MFLRVASSEGTKLAGCPAKQRDAMGSKTDSLKWRPKTANPIYTEALSYVQPATILGL
jgi:hypothetical protein